MTRFCLTKYFNKSLRRNPGGTLVCNSHTTGMRKMFTNSTKWVCAVAGILLLNAGCVSYQVHYSRVERRHVPAQHVILPCYGCLTVWRYHGMMHFTPEGPEWKTDIYRICFKEPTNSSHDFYFDFTKGTGVRRGVPVEVGESRGTVLVEGHSVLINIEYQDASGRWVKPPINGRRKIRHIYPDDMRRSTNSVMTK